MIDVAGALSRRWDWAKAAASEIAVDYPGEHRCPWGLAGCASCGTKTAI